MVIYGVALLALCTLIGQFAGDLLGTLLGVKANVGGVGFAMLLLLWASEKLKEHGGFVPQSAQGVSFWTAMYIPIVVAMASGQNVAGAVKGGPMALLAGVLATAVCFALIPAVARIGAKEPVAAIDSGLDLDPAGAAKEAPHIVNDELQPKA